MSPPPRHLAVVDELWADFAAALPERLAAPAARLVVTLGLAPSPDVPWSDVFGHPITLGAPLLVAEALPALPEAVVRDAALAHLLAVVEAFGTDRIEDGQVPATPALREILGWARATRDAALARVTPGGRPRTTAYAEAERETLSAIRAEHEALRGRADFARYLAVSAGKQRLGLPASLALADAAGWDAPRRRSLDRLLSAVAVALQLHDDVLDWEDDVSRGRGAWAVALATGDAGSLAIGDVGAAELRRHVHASGILARMLDGSARRFRAARRRAEALGATGIAAWAAEREATTADLARREAASPGLANRAHALACWARTVLA